MSALPADVHREILLRLPAASLFRFRIVCKAWQRVIDDPDFVKAHTNNHQQFSNPTTLVIRTRTGIPGYFFSLDSLNFINGQQTIQATLLKPPNLSDVPWLPPLPVASCNGLILLSSSDDRLNWAIWNPLTGDVHELPKLKADLDMVGCGIGYDRASDDYKVARIDKFWDGGDSRYVCQTHVYSLKMGSWKLIEDSPFDNSYLSEPVFLNGALHWFSTSEFNEKEALIAFDVGSENYHQLSMPPVDLPFGIRAWEVYLDAFDGCLVFSCFNDMKCFEGWMMKDYGAQGSWRQLFSFQEYDIIKTCLTLRPAAYLEDKNQVFLQHHGGLFWCDVESESTKEVSIDGLISINSCQMCLGSLFRLHDGCGVSGSVAPKTTGVKTERLTFHVRDIDRSSSYSSGWSEDEY